MLGVFQGGHRLGWATHVHPWAGVVVNGYHVDVGPFRDDHWIVVRPEGGGRSENDVLKTMIHEAIHHLIGGGHGSAFGQMWNCFVVDSGW